jgi:hypothetical protein
MDTSQDHKGTAGNLYPPASSVCTSEVLFRSKIFLDFDTVALSFLFDKHCLIMK